MAPTIEERVAYLEEKVEEHSKAWVDLKEHIVRLEQGIDRRFEAIERRIDALDQKFSRYFLWIIGIQVSVLLAIIATMLR